MFESIAKQRQDQEADPEWRKNNMEWDLRNTDWILEKVRTNQVYAQNLYAAMCNNEFQRIDVFPILANQTWSCSWRYAGGIIADMQGKGDYIDWYCSGIRDTKISNEEFAGMNEEQQAYYQLSKNYVSESVVTNEVAEDLKTLGWNVLDNDEVAV